MSVHKESRIVHKERRSVHKECRSCHNEWRNVPVPKERSLFQQRLNMNAYENSFIQEECKIGNKNYESYETSCNCYF